MGASSTSAALPEKKDTLTLSALAPAFHHVVFPASLPASRPPINFAPPRAPHWHCDDSQVTQEDVFVRWLMSQGGLDSRSYKPETLRRRVPACLRALRVSSVVEARAAVARSNDNLKTAISAIMIGVTGFFRDSQVFEWMAGNVLPALKSRTGTLRIWSVGCSDGPELYSVAMLLAECGILHRCQLLGTDCRPEALKRAANGYYEPEAVRSVPPPLLERYFIAHGSGWWVRPWMRTAMQWRQANALEVVEPGAWDLILCRNMSIYLAPSAVTRLWHNLSEALSPGGVLVLGKAERPLGARGLSAIAPCFYRRQVTLIDAPAARSSS